jgi:uncharacterized membrane protein YhfC
LRFARLQLSGVIAGLLAAIGVAIWGTGPLGAPLMVVMIGAVAFSVFYVQARWTKRK